MNYQNDTTLNEKDSLQDMLNMEKSVVKMYTTAIIEGCSDGYRRLVKDSLNQAIEDQVQVFFMMTENGYYKVESAPEQTTEQLKTKFSEISSQLN